MKNQDKLNKMCPAFQKTQDGIAFGDLMASMIALANEVKADMATLKVQFDGLVTDLNASTTNIGNFVDQTNTNKANVSTLITNLNAQKGNYDKIKKMLIDMCLASGGLAMSAGTTDQPKTVNTVTFLIGGKICSKAAADPLGAWTGGHTGLGNSEEAYYLMCLDVSGTFSTVEGAIVAATEGCVLPEVPADKCAIGAIKVVTGAAGVFVPDTTALDDGDITVTYEDFAMVHSGDGLAGDSEAANDTGGDFTDGGAASTRVCPAITSPAIKTLD